MKVDLSLIDAVMIYAQVAVVEGRPFTDYTFAVLNTEKQKRLLPIAKAIPVFLKLRLKNLINDT